MRGRAIDHFTSGQLPVAAEEQIKWIFDDNYGIIFSIKTYVVGTD